VNRKDALKRLDGLAPQVEEHLAKMAATPRSRSVPHWRKEVASWLEQMDRLLPALGKKTAAGWEERIAGWKAQLGV
jgi:hypothetical protein